MTFPVTATSHTLADYRARGGYRALEKALTQMKPQEVTQEVIASGLQGRGGAAFPVGRKWAVVKLDDGQPHYLCSTRTRASRARSRTAGSSSTPRTCLLESMLIASYAIGGRHSFVYIRGEFDLPYRRLAEAVEEAYAGRLLRRTDPGNRLRLRRVRLPRGRILRLRRGVRADHLDRGEAGLSAQPAAATDRPRPVPAADRGEQRRDARQHRRHHRPRGGGVPQGRHQDESRDAAHLDLGPHQPAGRVRGRARLPVGEVHPARTAAASSAGARSRPSSRAASPPRCSPRRTSSPSPWTTRRSSTPARRSAPAA